MMQSVLAINRDTDNLATLTMLLRSRGYCVIAKTDGASALSVIKAGADIALVILDYSLPDMDPLDFMTSLKRITSPAPQVIFLNDRVDVQDYLNAFSLGAFEFLFRPLHPPEFLRIVKAAMLKSARNDRVSAGNLERQGPGDGRAFPAGSDS